jgi:hypothetical protein
VGERKYHRLVTGTEHYSIEKSFFFPLSPNSHLLIASMTMYNVVNAIIVNNNISHEINYCSCHRPGTRMSGGNLCRSQSLPDVAGCSSDGDSAIPVGYQCSSGHHLSKSARSLPIPSEEEGLALLGTDTVASAALAPDIDQSILDYESDDEAPASTALSGNMEGGNRAVEHATTAHAAMETDAAEETSLGSDAIYHQCKTARLHSRKDILISVSPDNSFGKTVIVQSPQIGSLSDCQHIENTFHGSRIMKGSVITNDSISCSFDPSKLNCISCTAEHGIVGKDPLTVIFSDQNFPGTLSCRNGKCINIVRLENSSLCELFEIAREVFSHVQLPTGSIFLFGSSSELGRSGTSLYARSWTEVVARSSDLWPGVRICPLIPLIAVECPGSIVRELGEFSTWLEKVYDSDPQGLRDSWTSLVRAMETCSVGMTTTDIMETYKGSSKQNNHSCS